MKLNEFVSYDGIGLAQLIVKKEVTYDEVMQASLTAINKINPHINAIIESWHGHVEPNANISSPLYGAPFLIKDLAITMKGKKYELGSQLAQGMVMDDDSTLMSLYKQAGLVTLGRTTTSEFAISTTAEARFTGPTRNPWNTTYNAGGSTGGSAAAVAAGLVPLAHATDGGGSIRVPAAVNGLFGLKPTRGRVSSGPLQDEVWSGLLAHLGVSRTVRDSAALLDAISLPAVGEPYYTAPPAQSFLSSVSQPPSSLKIGLIINPPTGRTTNTTISHTIDKMAHLLSTLGHHIDAIQLDIGVSWEAFVYANAQFWNLNTAASIDNVASVTGRLINEENLELATLAAYKYGKNISGMDILAAITTRNTVSRRLGHFFERYDILMSPTVAELPLKIGEYNQVQNSVDGLGWIEHVFNQSPFTAVANIAGLPSMSVPAGIDPQTQLPIGAMFTAGFGLETKLFSLAGQIENAAPWAHLHPQIWAGNEVI